MSAMFTSPAVITGGQFTQLNDNRRIYTGKGNIDRLLEAASPAAFHNSGERRDPPKCHPNTRVAILEKLKIWILTLDAETLSALIVWLHGPAGSGKSAIAQTIAEWAFEEELLFASYFFSSFDSTRNHAGSLIASIAYQAMSYLPGVRERILAVIDTDPLIFTRSLMTQILTIIVDPLNFLITSGYFKQPKSRRLIIIDGLDECKGRDEQMDILRTISKTLQNHHLPLIFLIASRPEHDINYAFGSGYLRVVTFRLPLDDRYQSSSDIRLFLQDEFNDIKKEHPLRAQISPEWPTEGILLALVEKSSGQFIYAATVIKYVKSIRHRPVHRLDIVLGLRPSVNSRDMPFSELDALYHHLFSLVEDLQPVLRVLAFRILTGRSGFGYSVTDMELKLSLSPGDIRLLFCDLASVIEISDDDRDLRFLHASLEDFLLDGSRSKGLYIDPPIRHAEFAQALFPYPSNFLSAWDLSICAYHLERALPSEELRRDILNLNIAGIFRLPTRGRESEREASLGIQTFLRGIKASQFVDAEDLYLHHIRTFNKHAVEVLEKYNSEQVLAIAVATVASFCMKPFPMLYRTTADNLFPLDEQLKSLDLHGLNLIGAMVTTFLPMGESYIMSLQHLFSDENGLGKFAPDSTTYAIGATHFLRYICYHLVLEMPSYLTHGRATSRHNPWKWRQIMAWKKTTYRRILINTREWSEWNGYKISWKATLYKKGLESDRSLEFLAQLLPQAGRSDELIRLARRCNFGMLPYRFPERARVVKREAARYLKRMENDDV